MCVVDHGFSYRIVFCYFSSKFTALRSNSKESLVQNQDNVPKWSNLSAYLQTVVPVRYHCKN
jgi:hypothetical protein